MKVKTSELSGSALDYAVGLALEYKIRPERKCVRGISFEDGFINLCQEVNCWFDYADNPGFISFDGKPSMLWQPSADWSQAGWLIDDFNLRISSPFHGRKAFATVQEELSCGSHAHNGETTLCAICRAAVSAKLGDEVEIPDELMESK